MDPEDISQVCNIDQSAFPNWRPITDYERELHNNMAHYIVACSDSERIGVSEEVTASGKGFSHLAQRLRQLLGQDAGEATEAVLGFAGFWVLTEEAHVITIAVYETCRRAGIGELLMISLIDRALKLEARVVTLEVRVSNTAAQNLYLKCGFSRVGTRRGYYTDNHEDAFIMTTEDITSTVFQDNLGKLKLDYTHKWGVNFD